MALRADNAGHFGGGKRQARDIGQIVAEALQQALGRTRLAAMQRAAVLHLHIARFRFFLTSVRLKQSTAWRAMDKSGRILRYDLVDQQYPMEPDPAFRRRAAWILAEIGARFPAGNCDLLDIGCGQGFYFPLYLAMGARVTGVEADPVPLAQAMARGQALGAEVHAAQAEHLPFASGGFDAVVLSEVLEHLTNPELALAEAARVLRPGGLLLVTVPHANYPVLWDPLNKGLQAAGLAPIRQGIFAGIWANHERLYTAEMLKTQVAKAGFSIDSLIFQTRACLPFIHNLVYGIGRSALEGGILPKRWLSGGLRGAEGKGDTGRQGSGPIALAVRAIRRIDLANPDYTETPGPTVNLCLSATRQEF